MKKNMSILIVLSLIIVCSISLSYKMCDTFYPLKYEKIIAKECEKNNLDTALVLSLIYCESRFNKNATSSKGAIGLMQIMPITGLSFYEGEEIYSENLLYNPELNIKIGTKFLKYLFDKYGNEVMVLTCYNAGEGVVNRWKGDSDILEKSQIQYKETRNYVEKVLKMRQFYKFRLKSKLI